MYNEQTLPVNTILNGKNYQYCIEKVLGQGSFGITYLAKIKLSGTLGDLQTDIKVAVKEFFMRELNGRSEKRVLTGSNSELYDKYRKDFIREANNLSKLKHPNIVKVLELFEENNTAYFSMEYIEGGNLNDYINSNECLSEREALRSISQVVEALSCMHKNKMLHLDIKPLNIMRRTNGDLVLIDFGLSKQFNSDGEPESSTRIGRGTIGYAPLEQMNYKKEDGFSPTLDIYALGGTLYKMLTGITPPDASTIFNDGFPEESMKKRGIGQEIISLTLWAMEPMKRKRLQTSEEFLKEIQRISPNVSEVKKDIAYNFSQLSSEFSQLNSEPPLEVFEVCNGFHVHWNIEVSENEKNKIRELLKSMRKIGEKKLHVNSEYGPEQFSTIPIMSLGFITWDHLYPIIMGERSYFPPRNIVLALCAIQKLAYWTGLPFRLSNEDEIVPIETSAPTEFWENHKTLCYNKNGKLLYKGYVADGKKLISSVNEVNYYDKNTIYDIQLVCDGLKPLHRGSQFDIPCTQPFFDEIQPIGFSLYKTRIGDLWNIKSPESPISSYLDMGYDSISNIKVCHCPGGGPLSGYDFLGIEAHRFDTTYYFSFDNGRFNLLEALSDKDIKERQAWT